MSKGKKKTQGEKEELQAQRVLQGVFVSLVVLALVMLIGFSFFS